jgi:transmembrane 9 superfamily protein 2/4
MVNKAYSDNTQLQYAYYDLPFVCPPTGQQRPGSGLSSGQSKSLNLGEVLRGDRIMASDIDLVMKQDNECHFLCNQEINRADLKRAKEMVQDGYVVEWIVDNLPGATSFVTVDKTRKYYAVGFKLGYTDHTGGRSRHYLNNHHTLVIRYRRAPGRAGDRGEKVVVGFEVYTKSVGAGVKRSANGCPADLHDVDEHFELYIPPNKTSSDIANEYPYSSYHPEVSDDVDDDAKLTIPYSYSVYFREDESIDWNRRWDLYFVNQEQGSRIHWLAIVNSLIICGLLTGIVLMILTKTIRTDIKGYKEASAEDGRLRKGKSSRAAKSAEKGLGLLEQEGAADNDADLSSDDEALEDVTGWKLLHADVFRAPENGNLLAPMVGSGMQLLFMATGLVLLSAFGILNPSFRGGFISFGVGLFVFAGVFSGYFSARVYKTFGGQDWRKNTAVTAALFAGMLFSIVFVINLFVWAQASSTAIPFGTLVAIVFLWLCVQTPLVYVGSWYGYVHAGAWDHPTKTSTIPRQVPQQAWYIKGAQAVLLAGLIPFAVIFIELIFVFQSVWQDKSGYYYVFGFLAVVSTILVLTVAEVTVVTIYVQLCSENYHWWWQSFLVGGGSALWVFLYSVWYYFMKLHITGFVSSMLFFSYSFMACCVYGLLTGTVGFLSAYLFVRRIYGYVPKHPKGANLLLLTQVPLYSAIKAD